MYKTYLQYFSLARLHRDSTTHTFGIFDFPDLDESIAMTIGVQHGTSKNKDPLTKSELEAKIKLLNS